MKPNKELELAHEFIFNTNKSVFLTGKAGTGKTTFLKQIRQTIPKRMVVVAPTGVAAINAGGVTAHSFSSYRLLPLYQREKCLLKQRLSSQEIKST